MADKTFGVKASEETLEKASKLIEASPLNSKEWFEKAVALVELHELKNNTIDYRQDLEELEDHTKRIYTVVSNMIQRSIYLKDSAVRELSEKVEQKDEVVLEYQKKVKELTQENNNIKQSLKDLEDEKEKILGQYQESRSTNENNLLLIKEYKDKVDTLSSLINENKGYAKENSELKQRYIAEKEQLKAEIEEKEQKTNSLINELRDSARDLLIQHEQLQEKLDRTIKENEIQVNQIKTAHSNELTQLTERKELEKERAVLEVEKAYQEKLEKSHEQYNEKIAHLYEKLEKESTQKAKEKGEK